MRPVGGGTSTCTCDLGVAKGLLGDALDQVAELKKGRAAA